MNRRDFVAGAAGAAGLSAFPAGLAGTERESGPGALERRALGQDRREAVDRRLRRHRRDERHAPSRPPRASVRRSTPASTTSTWRRATATPRTCWAPRSSRYRKGVFLACKTQGRTREAAAKELDSSLRKLRTDHFDLYQHHAVTKKADVQTILGPGGAMEAFQAAKKAGKVRFLGFSAHSVEAALALMDGYAFDTILFPVNYATWNAGNFGPQVLARREGEGHGHPVPEGARASSPGPRARPKRYDKCWYEPFDTPEEVEPGAALHALAPRHGGHPAGRRDDLPRWR